MFRKKDLIDYLHQLIHDIYRLILIHLLNNILYLVEYNFNNVHVSIQIHRDLEKFLIFQKLYHFQCVYILPLLQIIFLFL